MSEVTGNTDLKLSKRKRFILIFTLSLLFGVGWGIGIAATSSLDIKYLRYSFQIIFVIIVSFHGLFLFFAYGVRPHKVRQAWLKWFYIAVRRSDKAYSLRATGTRLIKQQLNSHQNQYVLGRFNDMKNQPMNKTAQQSVEYDKKTEAEEEEKKNRYFFEMDQSPCLLRAPAAHDCHNVQVIKFQSIMEDSNSDFSHQFSPPLSSFNTSTLAVSSPDHKYFSFSPDSSARSEAISTPVWTELT